MKKENVVGNVKEIESYYDLLTVIMIGLGRPEKALDQPILRLLDVLLSTDTKPDEKKEILKNDYDISMTEEMIEEANAMCNLGEGIREQAEIKTKTQSIIDLMDSMSINIDKAMELLKIKSDDKEVYRQSVEKMLAVK